MNLATWVPGTQARAWLSVNNTEYTGLRFSPGNLTEKCCYSVLGKCPSKRSDIQRRQSKRLATPVGVLSVILLHSGQIISSAKTSFNEHSTEMPLLNYVFVFYPWLFSGLKMK